MFSDPTEGQLDPDAHEELPTVELNPLAGGAAGSKGVPTQGGGDSDDSSTVSTQSSEEPETR
jgi:hypothetical protein